MSSLGALHRSPLARPVLPLQGSDGPFFLRRPRPCRAPWHDPSTLPCLSS